MQRGLEDEEGSSQGVTRNAGAVDSLSTGDNIVISYIDPKVRIDGTIAVTSRVPMKGGIRDTRALPDIGWGGGTWI